MRSRRDKCTVIAGVPTMLHALAQLDVTSRDLAALRVAVSGGSSLPEDVMRTFEGKYGIEVLEGYGLSETGSTSSFNRPGDRKPLSVGKPIWGVQMRVADTSDQPLPPGRDQIGEIQIRGHNVMKGYRNRPEATASALAGGWLHTGDLGYSGRRRLLLHRRPHQGPGHPRRVQRVPARDRGSPVRPPRHPRGRRHRQAGRPARRGGRRRRRAAGRASTSTQQEIIAYCRERLAAYKYPREVRFRAELPKGPSGKILKTELREA